MFGSVQEQEDYEYRMGMASELQNAYSRSCIEGHNDDKPKIAELVAAGRFVLVAWSIRFCPSTDAVLPGRAEKIVKDFGTRDEAEAEYTRLVGEDTGDFDDGECGYDILPKKPYVPPAPRVYSDDEIPF